MNNVKLAKHCATAGLVALFMLTGCAPVTISSVPEHSKVYAKKSNKLIGETPVRVPLMLRSKEVVVRKDGYFSKTVKVSPTDPARRSIDLKRRDRVLLLSDPSGVDLFVEGRVSRIGTTPYLIDYNKPYREFTIHAPGYVSELVTIPEDPEDNITVKLTRSQMLQLVGTQKYVDVFNAQGQKLGTTPLEVSAKYKKTFELRKEGYYPKKIQIGPDTKTPYTFDLEREPVVIVYSQPEDAHIVHRGVVIGKTPFRRLVKEDMQLEIQADRHYTKKITVSPQSPRDVRVELDPKPYITITSAPAGAKLYRSGGVELIGDTPVEILVEKDMSLEMHLDGYDARAFMISPESSASVTVPLRKTTVHSEKTVMIDSQPSGAKIYRPGGAEFIGTTPLQQSVRSERTFELQLDGFETKIVTVAPDSADNVVFALARDESARNVTISDPLLNTPSSF